MPELEYFVVAESHSIDRDTGALSIFNIFSELRPEEFPFPFPMLMMISSWVSSDDEIARQDNVQVGIRIRVPGKPDEGPFHTNFTCGTRFQNLVLGYEGLAIDAPGMIEVELFLNNEHKARHRIYVETREGD